MKFPRHAKLLRSHFDVAPFAAVLFLLLIFLLLGALLPVPGIPLRPPAADNLPGIDRPSVSMAVDADERLYYENQIVTERQLRVDLQAAARGAREPLTLIIHADKSVSYDRLARLALLAREPAIGITNLLLATLPRADAAPAKP